MAEVPTCVAVIATFSDDSVQACTVSSLSSFDVENPGMTITLKKNSRTLAGIRDSGTFSASILTEGQVDMAAQFSSSSKSNGGSPETNFALEDKLYIPYLKSCQRVCFLSLENVLEMENVSMVFGRAISSLDIQNELPLIYVKRHYFALGNPLP
jgi:flavin reductase (DIM6/NTAB) family NADH-FMN oxidoreductase RutF